MAIPCAAWVAALWHNGHGHSGTLQSRQVGTQQPRSHRWHLASTERFANFFRLCVRQNQQQQQEQQQYKRIS